MFLFFILYANLSKVIKQVNESGDEHQTFRKKFKSDKLVSEITITGENEVNTFKSHKDENKNREILDSQVEYDSEEESTDKEETNRPVNQIDIAESNMNFDILIPFEVENELNEETIMFIKQVITDNESKCLKKKDRNSLYYEHNEKSFTETRCLVEEAISKLRKNNTSIYHLMKDAIKKNKGKNHLLFFPSFGEKNISEIIYNVEYKFLFNIVLLFDLIGNKEIMSKISFQNSNYKLLDDVKTSFRKFYYKLFINNLSTKKFRKLASKKSAGFPKIESLLRYFNNFVKENAIFYSFIFENDTNYINEIHKIYKKIEIFKNKNVFLKYSIMHYLSHPQNKKLRYIFPEFDWITLTLRKGQLDEWNLEKLYIICTAIAYNFEFLKSNIKSEIKETFSKDELAVESITLNTFILNTRILIHLFLTRAIAFEKIIKHSLLLCFFSFIRCKNEKMFVKFYLDDIFLVTLKNAFKISEEMSLEKKICDVREPKFCISTNKILSD